jgi:hypothetical protein
MCLFLDFENPKTVLVIIIIQKLNSENVVATICFRMFESDN